MNPNLQGIPNQSAQQDGPSGVQSPFEANSPEAPSVSHTSRYGMSRVAAWVHNVRALATSFLVSLRQNPQPNPPQPIRFQPQQSPFQIPGVLTEVASFLDDFDQIHSLSPLSADAALVVQTNLQQTSRQMTCSQLLDYLDNLQGQESILDDVTLTGKVTPELIQSLAKHPEICKLDLSQAHGVDHEIIRSITECLNPTHLNLQGACQLGDESIEALSKLQRLEFLGADVSAFGIQTFAEFFPAIAGSTGPDSERPASANPVSLHLNLTDHHDFGHYQAKLLKNIRGLESVVLPSGLRTNYANYLADIAAIPNLKHLKMTCDGTTGHFYLNHIQQLSQAQGLESLSIDLAAINAEESLAVLCDMPNLKNVQLDINRGNFLAVEVLSDQAIQNLAGVPGLTGVGLGQGVTMSAHQLGTLIGIVPNLETLKLSAPNDGHLQRLSEARNLKELNLIQVWQLTDQGYGHLQNLSNLEKLSCRDVVNSTRLRSLLLNVSAHPRITSLGVEGFGSGDGEVWAALGDAHRLESLTLLSGNIGQPQFQENLLKLTALKALDLSSLEACSSILNAIATLPELQKLVYFNSMMVEGGNADQLISRDNLMSFRDHPTLTHLDFSGAWSQELSTREALKDVASQLDVHFFAAKQGLITTELISELQEEKRLESE